ncbi:hypothetical protein QF026_003682 [Streptomyces aurantiacus]|uniref:hypothetical protein n=1 Tax=Streptomyces aurantiacus TaxID=47760 RepID=UPI00278E41FC|nr:hypothetical protein [Streptomyces aurantiacus]MDQ0775216.1 hypothetical protein [Streptomyces aurantiacus]
MTDYPDYPKDALADWLRMRPQISWPCWSSTRLRHEASHRDTLRDFFNATRGGRDTEGAADLAGLLGILITAAERRLSHGRQS